MPDARASTGPAAGCGVFALTQTFKSLSSVLSSASRSVSPPRTSAPNEAIKAVTSLSPIAGYNLWIRAFTDASEGAKTPATRCRKPRPPPNRRSVGSTVGLRTGCSSNTVRSCARDSGARAIAAFICSASVNPRAWRSVADNRSQVAAKKSRGWVAWNKPLSICIRDLAIPSGAPIASSSSPCDEYWRSSTRVPRCQPGKVSSVRNARRWLSRFARVSSCSPS